MHHIYCISGLGADHRIFQKLKIENAELHFINWTKPSPKEDLHSYALRLAQQIKHDKIILMGVSFGGMLTSEIVEYFAANQNGVGAIDIKKAILISSCKSPTEFPAPMKWIGKLNLYKLAPHRLILGNDRFNRIVFDLRSKEEELYLKRKMLHDNDLDFIRHAIHMIMKWKKPSASLSNLVHIHGNADRLLQPKNVHADYWVEDGGHFMVWNKADEISRIINGLLREV
jgi:pimeloyl-ACP methyl ester carboxylesterase